MTGPEVDMLAALGGLLPEADAGPVADPLSFCHAGQREAVADDSPTQAWVTTRRAGKTRGKIYRLLRAALARPNVNALYLTTTIKRGINTLWSELLYVAKQQLGISCTPDGSRHVLRLGNGSAVWVSGCETKTEADAWRGVLPRTAIVCLDEAQDWKPDLLEYTYGTVIVPTLADIDGVFVLAGTPGPPRGFFFDYAHAQDVSRHSWSLFDNPHIKNARGLMERAMKVRACDESDPSIRREFFGEFVADAQRQVFSVERGRNSYDALPRGDWCYVIGFDPGTVDKAAVVVWGWSTLSPKLYLVAYQALAGLGAGAQVGMVEELARRYPPVAIVADPATGGAAFILDLQDRFGAPVEAAEKQGKVAAVLLLRDALKRGEVLLPAAEFPSGEFVKALETPEWDPDKVAQSLRGHMPDVVDAALYGFRKARQFEYAEAPPEESEEDRIMRRMHEQRDAERRRVAELFGE